MKVKYISVAMLAGASLLCSSCVPYDYGTWSVSTNGYNTSVAWTNASYDVNGFPIYGYSYGRPVYGYTAAGVAIFTLAALTAACYVPHWAPAPWYRGSWHYPAHIHRAPAPPRHPAEHRPAQRPAGGMNAPIHKNPASVMGPARPAAHPNPARPSMPNAIHNARPSQPNFAPNAPKPGNNQPHHGMRPGNQGNNGMHNAGFHPFNPGNNGANNAGFRPSAPGNNGAHNAGFRPSAPGNNGAHNAGFRPSAPGNNGVNNARHSQPNFGPAARPAQAASASRPAMPANNNHVSRPSAPAAAPAQSHVSRPSAPAGGGHTGRPSGPGNGGGHSHNRR